MGHIDPTPLPPGTNRVNTNKIAFNIAKTEIILFKTSNKNYDADLKIKLCKKKNLCIPVC